VGHPAIILCRRWDPSPWGNPESFWILPHYRSAGRQAAKSGKKPAGAGLRCAGRWRLVPAWGQGEAV